MSSVNMSLKLIIKYGIYADMFAEKKLSHIFFFVNKNNCELDIVLTRTVNILITTNEFV